MHSPELIDMTFLLNSLIQLLIDSAIVAVFMQIENFDTYYICCSLFFWINCLPLVTPCTYAQAGLSNSPVFLSVCVSVFVPRAQSVGMSVSVCGVYQSTYNWGYACIG